MTKEETKEKLLEELAKPWTGPHQAELIKQKLQILEGN